MRLILLAAAMMLADSNGWRVADDNSEALFNAILFLIAWATLFDVIHAFKRRGEL